MVSANLVLIGETGNGKSSLGNFILGKQVFSVSDKPQSETQFTKGEYGDNEKRDIFVIDTPGLQDTEGKEREHLAQMVDYLKNDQGLQAIVVVLNYHQSRLALHIKLMLKLLCHIFPSHNFWSHVAFVWTRYYSYLPPKEKDKKSVIINEMMPNVSELIRETTGEQSNIKFPTFFIDSDFRKEDEFSCKEVNRLINWVHNLEPINTSNIKTSDGNIKERIVEYDTRKSRNIKKNTEYIKIERFKRTKQIHYDDRITFTDWEKVSEKTKQNILPRKIIEKKINKKKENRIFPEDEFGFYITDDFEKTINIFNDETIEYGEWKKVNTKGTRRQIGPIKIDIGNLIYWIENGHEEKAYDCNLARNPGGIHLDDPAKYSGKDKTRIITIKYLKNKYLVNPSSIIKFEVLFEVLIYLQNCEEKVLQYTNILENLQKQKKIPYDTRLSFEDLKDAVEYMKKEGILSPSLQII